MVGTSSIVSPSAAEAASAVPRVEAIGCLAESNSNTVSEPNATDKDYERVVLHTKYILITENHIDYRTYGRNDGVWRLRDIMTAILDMERYERQKTFWNDDVDAHDVDAHNIYLDAVSSINSTVTYRFGS